MRIEVNQKEYVAFANKDEWAKAEMDHAWNIWIDGDGNPFITSLGNIVVFGQRIGDWKVKVRVATIPVFPVRKAPPGCTITLVQE